MKKNCVYGLSIGVVGLTACLAGINLYNFVANDDLGALLGFSLGCFLIYTMLSTFITVDASNGFRVSSFIRDSYFWLYSVQFIITLASAGLMSLFPNSDITRTILTFISSIFSLVPALLGAYIAGISLTTISIVGNICQGLGYKISLGAKFFMRSFDIYKKMMFTGALIGFLLLMTKVGFGIAGSFNN